MPKKYVIKHIFNTFPCTESKKALSLQCKKIVLKIGKRIIGFNNRYNQPILRDVS